MQIDPTHNKAPLLTKQLRLLLLLLLLLLSLLSVQPPSVPAKERTKKEREGETDRVREKRERVVSCNVKMSRCCV